MEKASMICGEEEQIELPPGFRFHPTDEELITHYLSQKVRDSRFCARAIGEVDLNKCEPWDLPRKAKMGEKVWYFFCLKDRKYPTGFRTNRATNAGYWKATGKDKEIYKAKSLVGMKKTLVFYRGRAPKGTKTNWVMHEYRVEGKHSVSILPKTAKNEWVICRVFEKTSGGKKVILHRPYESGLGPLILPALMDSSPPRSKQRNSGNTSHVTCFSGRMEDGRTQEDMMEMLHSPFLTEMSPASAVFQFQKGSVPNTGNFQYPEAFMVQDNWVWKMLLEGQGEHLKPESRAELSQDSSVSNPELIQGSFDDQDPAGPVDLQCLWSY